LNSILANGQQGVISGDQTLLTECVTENNGPRRSKDKYNYEEEEKRTFHAPPSAFDYLERLACLTTLFFEDTGNETRTSQRRRRRERKQTHLLSIYEQMRSI
jgi:hypothetical protein